MKRFCSQRGQGLVEYLILVALIAVCSISIVSHVGKNVQELYAKVSRALQGENTTVTISRDRNEMRKQRGFDDFEKGAEVDN